MILFKAETIFASSISKLGKSFPKPIASTYTYIHTYIHTHTYIHIHTYTYIHTNIHKHTCTCIHMHTDIHSNTHIQTCTCIHIHTETYTHTHSAEQAQCRTEEYSARRACSHKSTCLHCSHVDQFLVFRQEGSFAFPSFLCLCPRAQLWQDSSMATHLPTGSCGNFDSVNGTASPPVHLSYPSSAIVSCNTHGSWKDQHCRRQTPPLPGCLFRPCFKIHDSSFQSVMFGRWCHSRMHGTRTLHVQESCTRPYLGESGRSRARARDRAWRLTSLSETGTMALFSPWRCLRFSYRHRDGHSCLVTETGSGGASASVHLQCGGHSCLATETDHVWHLQQTTREHFDPNVLGSTVGSAS